METSPELLKAIAYHNMTQNGLLDGIGETQPSTSHHELNLRTE
jgi:hypothetical protein